MQLEVLGDSARRAVAYLQGVSPRRVAPDQRAVRDLQQLGGLLPADPSDPCTVIDLLDRIGSPATVATVGGRFFGFVNGAAVPASIGATWLASAWDQNAALRVMSPAAAAIEDVALGWVRDLLELPLESGGALVTGATMANFCGILAARHSLLERAGWDVESDGLFGAPAIQVVVGDEVHISLVKALGMAGLGRKRIARVPVDGQGRLRPSELPPLDQRTLVCIQAGNVNTGAFDPAEEIRRRARDAGAWAHVDGAFGLWAAASPKYRHLTAGFAEADSWATDAHKWPNVGYDCGIALVRDAAALRAAMAFAARLGTKECLDHMRRLALHMQDAPAGSRLVQVNQRAAAELLAREFGGSVDAKQDLLERETQDSGIVTSVGNDLKFWHLSFQEYLAALEIAGLSEQQQIERVVASGKLYHPDWRETMGLLGGVLLKQGQAKVEGLLQAILDRLGDRPTPADQVRLRRSARGNDEGPLANGLHSENAEV